MSTFLETCNITQLEDVSSLCVCRAQREKVASLRGRDPGSRGTSAVGSNLTENTGMCDSDCEVWSRVV
jgi:hypothetical protein